MSPLRQRLARIPGELEQLSFGRHLEREEPPEFAREVLPERGRKRAYVPAHRTRSERVGGTLSFLLGLSFLPVLGLGIPIMAQAVFGRTAFVVDFRRSRVGLRQGTSDRSWTPIDRATSIEVVPASFVTSSGEPGGYNVQLHADWPESPLRLFVRDRVLAHRFAFQLSQLTGVRVGRAA